MNDICVNERAFDKQSSSTIMCDKTQRSAINVFQQPLKCDNEEIDCDVAELDQKTKRILHVIFRSSIILLSQFCSLYANRSILCVVFPNVPVVIA
jgi:hypothetical protein